MKLLILFTLAVFFPLSFGDLGPIAAFRWIEWMAPIIFLGYFGALAINKEDFFPGKAKLFYAAILVITVWSIINYARNPVSAERLMEVTATAGGIRAYYSVFVGVLTFFSSLWFFRYRKINEKTWLLSIIIFSLSVGLLRLLSYFGGFDLPLLYGNFRYGGGTDLYHRIGGLSEAAIPALAALFGYYYRRKWNVYFLVCLAICLTLLFFSGGRGSCVGTLLAVTLYCFIVERRALRVVLSAVLLLLVLYVLIAPHVLIPAQLDRISAVSGMEEGDIYRFHTFQYYWSIFKQNPIFGKGVGYYQPSAVARGDASEFVLRQLVSGGHGSYYSILAIFGIGGIFFLLVMLLGSMHRSYKLIMAPESIPHNRLMVFAFIYLVALSVELYVGGRGYTNLPIYYLAGMTAGIAGANKQTIARA